MKIMLDAGHGYDTSGKRSPGGLREYEFNRVVANYAKNLLDDYQNVTIYFAHSDKLDVPLAERTNKANQLNVDCYVSIHANAYGTGWNSAGGIETYVYPSRPKEAYELAQKIQKQLVSSTGLSDRGVKTADFHVLRETNMTAVLAECGFMTNKEEESLLRTDSFRKKCAEAIVKAIADQYNLKKTAKTEPKPKESIQPASPKKGHYKVQVGSFIDKQNAEELAERLKKLGFIPYIDFE